MPWEPRGDLQSYEFMPVDTRIVEEIERNPRKLAEQGGSTYFMRDWGGSENYKQLSKLTPEQRLVYAAACQGISDPEAIADALAGTDTFQKLFRKIDEGAMQKVEKALAGGEEPPVVPTKADAVSEILGQLQRKGYVKYS